MDYPRGFSFTGEVDLIHLRLWDLANYYVHDEFSCATLQNASLRYLEGRLDAETFIGTVTLSTTLTVWEIVGR